MAGSLVSPQIRLQVRPLAPVTFAGQQPYPWTTLRSMTV